MNAKELYGSTPEYKEMEEKQKNRTEEDEKILADRFMLLFKEAGERIVPQHSLTHRILYIIVKPTEKGKKRL